MHTLYSRMKLCTVGMCSVILGNDLKPVKETYLSGHSWSFISPQKDTVLKGKALNTSYCSGTEPTLVDQTQKTGVK